jgi:fibronectin type 3 domain-containing protein
VATPTFTVPKNINLYSKAAGLISGFSNSSPANLSLIQGLLTWNLHQPPINTSVRTEMNRSLFVKEYYNILSWQPNPQNDQFSVVEYKIYRKVSGGQYGLVDSVPADTYEYMDLISATGEVLEYALTSVDSEGRESPKSIPAKTS